MLAREGLPGVAGKEVSAWNEMSKHDYFCSKDMIRLEPQNSKIPKFTVKHSDKCCPTIESASLRG